jgi:hypothetical protein
MGAGMNDTIHVKIQIIKFYAIWVWLRGINGGILLILEKK